LEGVSEVLGAPFVSKAVRLLRVRGSRLPHRLGHRAAQQCGFLLVVDGGLEFRALPLRRSELCRCAGTGVRPTVN